MTVTSPPIPRVANVLERTCPNRQRHAETLVAVHNSVRLKGEGLTTQSDPPVTVVPDDERIAADDMERAGDLFDRLTRAYDSKVVGQPRLRTTLVVTLLAEGHILLESVPGLAKTTAAATLACAVNASFVRIQCTPDLLPSDILGTQVYDPHTATFDTRLGPVHANFVLLDEINRSSAKTQSAMLEAMQERQTSIGGVMYPLPSPFMVLATQNPIEEEGTYILPEAQLDRFLLKDVIDYPTADEELEVLDRIDSGVLGTRAADLQPVVELGDVDFLIDLAARVYVDSSIKRYAVAITQATRRLNEVIDPALAEYVEFGASPRGAIALQQVGRAQALMHGRTYVLPDDVRALRHAVFRHRLHLGYQAVADGIRVEDLIDAVFAVIPSP
jgi:MoxR-like ATPase